MELVEATRHAPGPVHQVRSSAPQHRSSQLAARRRESRPKDLCNDARARASEETESESLKHRPVQRNHKAFSHRPVSAAQWGMPTCAERMPPGPVFVLLFPGPAGPSRPRIPTGSTRNQHEWKRTHTRSPRLRTPTRKARWYTDINGVRTLRVRCVVSPVSSEFNTEPTITQHHVQSQRYLRLELNPNWTAYQCKIAFLNRQAASML